MNLDYVSGDRSADFEKNHWWVRSRFTLIDRIFKRLPLKIPLHVLEVGSGTGVNLDYIETHYGERLTRLIGVDPGARPMHREPREERCELPESENFDLILAMDVLEHVDRPAELLDHLRNRLKPSGFLLVSVPAFSCLWTRYDELAHHRKRYARRELLSELREAHVVVEECFYLFGILFPLFVVQRLALKWRPTEDAHVFKPVSHWLNQFLFALTSIEMRTVMPYNRWIGSSIIAIARRAS